MRQNDTSYRRELEIERLLGARRPVTASPAPFEFAPLPASLLDALDRHDTYRASCASEGMS